MQDKKLAFMSIDDVKQFCDICNEYDFEVDLFSGKYIVDGKSIMGIFSLDLSKPVFLKANCGEECEFLGKISKFIVQ